MTKILGGIAAVVLFVGCGEQTSGTTDSGKPVNDAGTTRDAGDNPVVDAGSGQDAGSSMTDAGTAAATCAGYCAKIQANCTGTANAQYGTLAACLGSCSAFTAGTIGAQAGNSLECRAYHAGAAQADPATHCSHAGPAGDGVCGSNCEGFCTIAQSACTGSNLQFPDAGSCPAACASYASVSARYNSSSASGNSYACRMYHLSVAATSGGGQATVHCPHITPASATCQ